MAANYNLGLIALAQDSPAEALRHFETVARANHSDAAAWIGMLESQLILRKTDDARQTATQIETLLDASDPRLFQVATLLAQHGESAAAIPLMERVRQAFPQSYDVSYNLALAYLEAAQYDRAALVLRPLADAQGKAEAFDLLGAIEEKRGHTRMPSGRSKRPLAVNPRMRITVSITGTRSRSTENWSLR